MLSLLALIYGKIADIRNALYDKGVFEMFDLGARVVSIGNITAGGTGKTPLVAYVAELLASRGEKVCILTRGYGRENAERRVLVSDSEQILAAPSEAGDEPYELAQKLLGKAIVIADADRVAAAEWAKRKFGVTAFVLDDGFQHRKVKRDVDIVCIDATAAFIDGKMLPAGRLREPLHNLARADIIVITRADLVEDISNLRSEISEIKPNTKIFVAENNIARIVELEEFHAEPQSPQSKQSKQREYVKGKGFAFCGLGNPENFFEMLRRGKVDLVGTRALADHYRYCERDIAQIENEAKLAGADGLLTTAKDAVKLKNPAFTLPCYVVEIEMKLDDADGFAAML